MKFGFDWLSSLRSLKMVDRSGPKKTTKGCQSTGILLAHLVSLTAQVG